MAEITALLRRANDGDLQARESVFSLLYEDLKVIARARLSTGGRDLLLDSTSLVNECYLRLASAGRLETADRHRYLAYASQAMRSVIVDFVRARKAERRGGQAGHITLDTGIADSVQSGEAEILRVHEALEELAKVDERLVRVVEMRYFVGLDERAVAEALGVTERTVRRDWSKARLLLAAALK